MEKSAAKTLQSGVRAKHGSYRAGFFFGTLTFCAMVGTGLISTIVTARLYGIDVIGQYALVAAPVAAIWVLSTVKEQQALIREITGLKPREPRVTQLFAAVFTFSMGLTLLVGMLAAGLCLFMFPGPFHAPELLAPALVSIAGYVFVTNTGWNIDSIFSAFVAGRQLFWVRLNESLSYLAIAIALGLTWRSVWGLVIAIIGGSFVALIHRAIAVRPFIRIRLSSSEYRNGLSVLPELLRFGLRATPGQIAQGVSGQGGVWALGMVAPVSVVGAFSRALTMPRSLQQASMRITEVLYPTLVGRHTKGDGRGFDRALIDSIRYEVIGLLLVAAAIGGAAHSVLDLFGHGFSQATLALVLLMLYPVVASVTVAQTQALWAVNKPGRTSVIAMVRLLITVMLLVTLVQRIGIVGPAIALLAGYLVVAVLSGFVLRSTLERPLRSTWPLRERLALIISYAAGFVSAHLAELVYPSALGLPLCLLAGSIAYVAVLLVCGGLNKRDFRRLAELTSLLCRQFQLRKRRRTGSPDIVEGGANQKQDFETVFAGPGDLSLKADNSPHST